MKKETVLKSLNAIDKTYEQILSTKHVLAQARAQVMASHQLYESFKGRTDVSEDKKRWGYVISPTSPLVFVPSSVRDMKMNADIYCKLYWGEGDLPVEQDIKIRVWTTHEGTMFREEWDAAGVKNQLEDLQKSYPFRGRMIARWHFDRATAGAGASGVECHPTFHLQYGGAGVAANQGIELSWHPEKINIPRVPCAPMDLTLACQLVAANFHYSNYVNDKGKPEWLRGIKPMEEALLAAYYTECLSTVQNQRKTVFDQLCAL